MSVKEIDVNTVLSVAISQAFDLYSCFPCAVEIAACELGNADDDPRPLTVTGGLSFFGGPGNDYSLHGIATMMDRLRAAPGTVGPVSALGWFMTKHAIGIYGTARPATRWSDPATVAAQREADRVEALPVAAAPQGPAHIETYTIVYGRDGACERGSVLGRLDDSRRFVARLPDDRTLLEALTRSEGISEHVQVKRLSRQARPIPERVKFLFRNLFRQPGRADLLPDHQACCPFDGIPDAPCLAN